MTASHYKTASRAQPGEYQTTPLPTSWSEGTVDPAVSYDELRYAQSGNPATPATGVPAAMGSAPHAGGPGADRGVVHHVPEQAEPYGRRRTDQDASAASGRDQGRNGACDQRAFPRPWSGVAVAGFILAIFMAPVGFVMSLFALGLTGPGRPKGRRLAIAGAGLGIVLSVGAVYGGLVAYQQVSGLVAMQQAMARMGPGGAGMPGTPGVGAPGAEGPGAGGPAQPGGSAQPGSPAQPGGSPQPGSPAQPGGSAQPGSPAQPGGPGAGSPGAGGPGAGMPVDAVAGPAGQEFLKTIKAASNEELGKIADAQLLGAAAGVCMASSAGQDAGPAIAEALGISAEAATIIVEVAAGTVCAT